MRGRSGALVRLSDTGTEAVPYYIEILDEFKDALDESGYSLRKQKVKEIGKAPIGAMIGLCWLGEDALPAKEFLYSLISEERPRWTISVLATTTLIEMGFGGELQQKYQSNESLLYEIRRAIGEKERAEKKGRDFCRSSIIL